MRTPLVLLVALVTQSTLCSASDACYGASVVIADSNKTSRIEYYYGTHGNVGSAMPKQRRAWLSIRLSEPLDACQLPKDSEGQQLYRGSVLLSSRGNCTFMQKALQAERAGAAALIIYNTKPDCLAIGRNLTGPTPVSIPVLGISGASGSRLRSVAERAGAIVFWEPDRPPLDPASGLIWLIATSTVAIAALWAGHDYTSGRQCVNDGTQSRGRRSAPTQQTDETVEVQMVSGIGAVAFIAIASSMLLVLYFFLNHVFAVVLVVLFSFAAFQALVVMFAAWIGLALPDLKTRKHDWPWIGQVATPSLLAVAPAVVWIGAWFALDPNRWGWVFQDGMGIALMILVLRQFMLPDLKVASLLLPLCFVYDVFWVFIQPLLTSGPSVMVEVARGGSSHEAMPMLLLVPSLWGPPYGTSILGYGDVVLPGLLLVFARIWDRAFQKAPAASYFWPLVGGYGVGLLLTFAALVLEVGGGHGQPALLYLIPCTLGLCAGLAWRRGELRPMWRGVDAELKRMRSGSTAADLGESGNHQGDEEALLEPPRSHSPP